MLTQKPQVRLYNFQKLKARPAQSLTTLPCFALNLLCLKFTFQAYFKPYAMKQFSPLEKKAVKLSSF
ncbi:hypothetical protein A0Y86_07425 [Campylobacter upsaliensis]|nr:hypothetical protein [Campylobacter upsaliensis]